MKLWRALISMELRKAFAYRLDFWVDFFISAVGRLSIAYFLWNAMYSYQNVEVIGGRTFKQMIYYVISVFFVDHVVRNTSMRFGIISREIYEGGLTRYLLYPVGVMSMKLSQLMGNVLVSLSQMLVGFLVLSFIVGPDVFPSLEFFAMGLFAMVPAILLYFMIVYFVELTAFWADNVWSLLVMVQFISGFLGGTYVPVSVFPESAQILIKKLPFYYTLGAPAEALLGQMTWAQTFTNMLQSFVWALVLFCLIRITWARGLKRYTGVGI